ncbi:MAG: ABC transporter ATP-binding protein [Bacteroidetes bacterium]|nr:MAG: ABC transporter ATP-binding protein [Bacteroidota bacterium]
MNYLSVENLTKSFGDRVLFRDLNFGIDQGQKVAIVAKNGKGKTTLLRCLMDLEQIDSGRVVYRKDIRVAFMEQGDQLDPDNSILEEVLSYELPEIQALKRYQLALQSEDEAQIEACFQQMSDLQAWEIEVRVKQILSVLKLDDLSQKIDALSGGQKKRVSLAKVLISEADFLLLDEPTNHLDLDMIEWLEEYLSRSKSTILMVTHDRYFLEVVCNQILELEDEQIYRYKGNFSYYLEKKAERREQLEATVEKAKNTFKKELDWIRRQPKARGTKQKARIENFHEVKKVAKTDLREDELDIPIKMERLGTKILELHKVSKSYDEKVILDQFSYHFQRRERLGIVGHNGSGKSTFLNLIQELVEVDGGKIVRGDTVQFGYYSQELIKVDDNKKVIDIVRDIAEYIPLEKGKQLRAAQLLEKFLFPRDMHYHFVHKLSGGEKRRLKLLTVLMANPNFLILDEPTNDLDIFVMSVLEEYLKSFPGCLIVVSHDRYFMDKMVDHLFVFEGQGVVKDILGNYQAYREQQKQELQAYREQQRAKEEKVVTPTATPEKEKRKLSYKEKQEFEQIEGDLETLEAEKEKLTATLSDPEADNETLMKAGEELARIVSEIDTKTERWLELSELA